MKKFLFYLSAVAVMFSSCSKDATEVSAPSLEKGVKAFSASIDVESENSTRLVVDGTKYLWSAGDAIGVASSTDLTANVFVSTPVGGENPEFVVSSDDYERWMGDWKLNESPLYLYFPYKDGIEFEEGGIINLSINKDQRYASGSFYKNSVPAVGYAETYSGPEQDLKLDIPTALIQVWFAGVGETQKIKLSIKNASGKYYQLNGNVDVDVTAEKPAFIFADAEGKAVVKDNADDSTYVTVNFGNKTGNLNYAGVDGNLPVHFIVPAGLDMSGATLEFELLDADDNVVDDEEYTMSVAENRVLPSNFRMNLQKTDGTPVYITFGMDGKFVIEDDEKFTAEEKFLGYAYMAQTQNNDGYPETATDMDHLGVDWGYMATLGADWNTIAWIKASTTPELDFTGYDKEWATQQYNALAAEINALGAQEPTLEQQFKLRLYKWYADNDGAIEPLAYNSIVGDDDEKPIVIKGLKVKGSGIIGISPYSLPGHTCSGAKLKNLKFVNCTVEGSSFLAADSNLASNFENVVLGVDPEGNANLVEYTGANYAGALFAVARPNIAGLISEGGVVIEKLPTVVAVRAAADGVKGQIAGLFVASQPIAFDLTDYNVTSLAEPVFGVINNAGLVTVDTADAAPAAATAPYAGFVGSVATNATASIIVDDTAYWNGTTATSNDGVAPLTAEELAYVLTSKNNATIELALNYDMQGGELNLEAYGQNPNPMVISGAKTISNLTVNTHKNSYHASLFGKTANLTGLTLKNITIKVVKQVSGEYTTVAGLAQTGTATDVTVDGLTVTLADGVEVENGIIGGLFSAVAPANLNNVTANKVTLNALESIKTAGIVAGKLNLATGDAWKLSGITVSGAKYTGLGEMTLANKASLKTVDAYKVNSGHIGDYAYDDVPFGVINVAAAAWGVAGTPKVQTLTGENCSYDRLAARIFVKDIPAKAASAAIDADVTNLHAYQFHLNEVSGSKWSLSKFGFVYNSAN